MTPQIKFTIFGMILSGENSVDILRFIRLSLPSLSLQEAVQLRRDLRNEAYEAAKATLCAENELIRWHNAYSSIAAIHGPTKEHRIPQGRTAAEIQFGPGGVWSERAATHWAEPNPTPT